MRVGVLADIHSNTTALTKIKKRLIHNLDLVLLLGDNTHYGGTQDMEKILEIIDFPNILALPGNLDSEEIIETFEKKGISLHGRKSKINGFTFIGFGGGLPHPNAALGFSEEEIYAKLSELCRGEENIVLCTHVPPFGTSIDLAHGTTHIGSKSVRKIIEEFKPIANVCGHCHEAAGEEKIDKTVCINAGPVMNGYGLVLELGKKVSFERMRV
ncbi:MAG: metallophosphoesterase family protein [Candidatus Diapherotrites archaeon]|nr:metallophosphoesterase family protein [Candidatus Diapherotrites archaeon]